MSYLHRYRTLPINVRRYLPSTVLRTVNFTVSMVALNLYLHRLGLDASTIGVINGLPAIANLVFGAPFGRLADRYGFRPFFLAGGVIAPLAAVGIAWSHTITWIMVLAFIQGIGSTTGWVMTTPFLSNETPRERLVEVLSLNGALMGAVGFVGSLLAGVLPVLIGRMVSQPSDALLPLRWTYTIGASLALLSLPFLFAIRENRGRAAGEVRTSARSSPPLDRRLVAKLLLVDGLIALGAGMMVPFFQLFFFLRYRFSPTAIGAVFAVGSVVASAATLTAPLLVKRLGTIRTTITTQAASLPFLAALAWIPNAPLAVASYWVRGSVMNMASPAYAAFEMEMIPSDQRGMLSGLQAVFGGMGRGGIGPFVSGYLQSHGGFGPAFSVTLVMYAMSSFMAWVFFGRGSQRQGASAPASEGVAD